MTTSNRCRLLLTLAILLCADFAFAQQTQNNSGFISSTQCVLVPASGLNTGGYGVTGTWTGTLTAYGVVGQGAAASLGSATTNGSYTVSIAGYTLFEVCGNTVGSGAAFVQVTASSAGSASSGGGCIATVSTLSSHCGTTAGTLASVTDGSTTSDCTVGGGSNKNACIYNGSAWAFAGNAGSNPTFAQVATGTNVSATDTVGSGGTLNVASGAVIDFSLIGTGTFKIPQSAGCTSSATKNICLDTTANLLHVYQNSADSTFGTGAFAAAYSLPTATNSVLGGVKPDGTSILNTSGAISVTPTSIGLGNVTNNAQLPIAGGTMTGKLITLAPTTGGAGLNLPQGTAPTSPTNGDLWATSGGLYVQIQGATVGPLAASGGTLSFPATVTGTTTQYHFPYFATTTSFANDSNLSDNGTALSYSGTGGVTASAGPLTAGNPSGGVGSSLFLTQEGTVPSGLSTSGEDNCYADSTQHGLLCNFNAGTTLPMVQGPASATSGHLAAWSGTNGGKLIDGGAQIVQSLTTTGTSGASTLSGGVLNIPQYSGGSGTINNAAQYDVPYYSATGTTNTVSGAAISGFQFDSTGGAPAAATAAQLVTLLGSTAIPSPGAIGGTTPAAGSFTTLTGATINTTTHCAGAGTAANPSVASCSAAAAGFFSCATNASTGTCVVDTTAVTANSVIQIQPDSTLGTALSVTCNTSADTGVTAPRVSARTAATSFTITLGTFSTNPECFSYLIVN